MTSTTAPTSNASGSPRRSENASYPVLAMTERQWQVGFLSMMGDVKMLIGIVGLVTAFAVLLVTRNTIAMDARERSGEAALLRILGYPRAMVMRLLMAEALCYGCWARSSRSC